MCYVLGFRRQTYCARKWGHRPEVVNEEFATELHQAYEDHPYWGLWKIFHWVRRKPEHTFDLRSREVGGQCTSFGTKTVGLWSMKE